jgi:ketosteroid isomerase-like protein
MSQENVQIVQRGLEHLMATGESLWEGFDEDVRVHDHDTMDQGEYRGHAGVAQWLEDWGAAWAEWSIEPEEFLDVGEYVVMVFQMKATGRDSGIALERQDAQVFKMRGGKVVRLDYYNSKQEALKAVGLAD